MYKKFNYGSSFISKDQLTLYFNDMLRNQLWGNRSKPFHSAVQLATPTLNLPSTKFIPVKRGIIEEPKTVVKFESSTYPNTWSCVRDKSSLGNRTSFIGGGGVGRRCIGERPLDGR